jgi:hypothetical protein
MFVSGVNDTGNKREKFQVYFFSFFVKSLVECTLYLKMEFLLFFIFRRSQANIGRTPPKSLSVVLTPVNSFSAVSLTLTPAINFRLFGYL